MGYLALNSSSFNDMVPAVVFCPLSPSILFMFFDHHSLPSYPVVLACVMICLQRTIKIIFPGSFTDPLCNHIVYFCLF